MKTHSPESSPSAGQLIVSESRIEELLSAVDQIQQVRISSAVSPAQRQAAEDALRKLDRASARLQVASLMSLEQQVSELALSTAERLGKRVQWLASGFELEVSEALRETLSMVLLHAVRNAADHGLETVVERTQAGKPAEGRIRASLSVRNGVLSLLIADDGRGIELDTVCARAVEKGFVDPQKAAALSPEAKLDLIFISGFSTRDESTDFSGRGIGLDAVRTAVKKQGGTVIARTRDTGGFVLDAVVPVSVVGVDALPVICGEQELWFPSGSVEVLEGTQAPEDGILLREFFQSSASATSPAVQWLRLTVGSRGPLVIGVDRILGAAQFKAFRRVDTAWSQYGPSWGRDWFSASDGNVLACRGERGLAFLADPYLLKRILTRPVSPGSK